MKGSEDGPDDAEILRAHLDEAHGIIFEDGVSINPVPVTLNAMRWVHRRLITEECEVK